MDNNHILTEIREDGIATVTLNRAEVHNAFNDTVIADLTGVLRRLGDDVDADMTSLLGSPRTGTLTNGYASAGFRSRR